MQTRKPSRKRLQKDVIENLDEGSSAKETTEEFSEYKCLKCDKKYMTSSALNKHKLKHDTIQLKYHCNFQKNKKKCKTVCSQAHTLVEHFRDVHSKIVTSDYVHKLGKKKRITMKKSISKKRVHKLIRCKECKKKIKSANGFKRHVNNIHNSDDVNKFKLNLSEISEDDSLEPLPAQVSAIERSNKRSRHVSIQVSPVKEAQPLKTQNKRSARASAFGSPKDVSNQVDDPTIQRSNRRSRFDYQPSEVVPDILFAEKAAEETAFEPPKKIAGKTLSLFLSTDENDEKTQFSAIFNLFSYEEKTQQSQETTSTCGIP